jgi:fibronectin type 3 domain-containing protein
VYYEIGSSSTKNFADNVAGTSYTHTGLQASTIYYYYIKAKNSAGESGYSSYASATTSSSGGNGGGVPGRVSSGTVTVQSSTSLRLTWETVSGATGYSIYRAVLSSDPPSTPTYYVSGGNTNSYTDASLTTGSLYRYWITAVNSAGESDQRYLGSGVPTTPSTNTLNAPTGVMTTVLSSSSIRVSWNEVSGATGYRVYYGSAGDSNPTLYYSVEGRTSYDFSYLYSGSVYYYKVSAVSSAGVGPASSLVTAVPTAAPSGYGSIKIENNSSIWMITLVQIKEQGAVGLVYNEVYDIEPGDYELYNYIPAGKTYDVFIMDSYLDGYNRSVTLSTNQTVTLSYNGTSFTIK